MLNYWEAELSKRGWKVARREAALDYYILTSLLVARMMTSRVMRRMALKTLRYLVTMVPSMYSIQIRGTVW